MSQTTNILITGSNRDLLFTIRIGEALLAVFLSRPNHIAIAGVRDPSSDSAKSLLQLPRGENSKLHIVKIDSWSETDAKEATELLRNQHGITKLDIVIANAGIGNYLGLAAKTPAKEMTDHFWVNSVAPLILFQATLPLMEQSSKPIFAITSSIVGSIGAQEHIPLESSAYGASKAAANFIARRIHLENPKLIAFPMHPGWLQTDMGKRSSNAAGMDDAPTTLADGVNGMIDKIDHATREKTSGTFVQWDGQVFGW